MTATRKNARGKKATTKETTLRDVELAARGMGLQIQVFNVSSRREINAAFATFERARPDALFVGGDGFFGARRVQVALPPSDPCDICDARNCRSGRANVLRKQRSGCVASGRRLYRPHSQGRNTCRKPPQKATKASNKRGAKASSFGKPTLAASSMCGHRVGPNERRPRKRKGPPPPGV